MSIITQYWLIFHVVFQINRIGIKYGGMGFISINETSVD